MTFTKAEAGPSRGETITNGHRFLTSSPLQAIEDGKHAVPPRWNQVSEPRQEPTGPVPTRMAPAASLQSIERLSSVSPSLPAKRT
jgi:hypothetical protein